VLFRSALIHLGPDPVTDLATAAGKVVAIVNRPCPLFPATADIGPDPSMFAIVQYPYYQSPMHNGPGAGVEVLVEMAKLFPEGCWHHHQSYAADLTGVTSAYDPALLLFQTTDHGNVPVAWTLTTVPVVNEPSVFGKHARPSITSDKSSGRSPADAHRTGAWREAVLRESTFASALKAIRASGKEASVIADAEAALKEFMDLPQSRRRDPSVPLDPKFVSMTPDFSGSGRVRIGDNIIDGPVDAQGHERPFITDFAGRQQERGQGLFDRTLQNLQKLVDEGQKLDTEEDLKEASLKLSTEALGVRVRRNAEGKLAMTLFNNARPVRIEVYKEDDNGTELVGSSTGPSVVDRVLSEDPTEWLKGKLEQAKSAPPRTDKELEEIANACQGMTDNPEVLAWMERQRGESEPKDTSAPKSEPEKGPASFTAEEEVEGRALGNGLAEVVKKVFAAIDYDMSTCFSVGLSLVGVAMRGTESERAEAKNWIARVRAAAEQTTSMSKRDIYGTFWPMLQFLDRAINNPEGVLKSTSAPELPRMPNAFVEG